MIEIEQVEISRVVSGPIAEVFRWWTEAPLLERWMSPVGSVEAEVDLRVGGRLRITMKDQSVEIEHRGEYVEIDRPRRIVFTWESRFTSGPSLVTVSLESVGDAATRVVIVHSQLPPAAASSHAGGWGAMVDRLERELVAR